MLKHATRCGATVIEETKVVNITFESTDLETQRPVSASWKDTKGRTGVVSFDWLVDASGRNGLVSKHLGNRKFNPGLKNVASWGYWKGTGTYSPETSRAGSPYFEALTGD